MHWRFVGWLGRVYLVASLAAAFVNEYLKSKFLWHSMLYKGGVKNVRCTLCEYSWIFPIPFTSGEACILKQHVEEHHPHLNAELVVCEFLGKISDETDLEILQRLGRARWSSIFAMRRIAGCGGGVPAEVRDGAGWAITVLEDVEHICIGEVSVLLNDGTKHRNERLCFVPMAIVLGRSASRVEMNAEERRP